MRATRLISLLLLLQNRGHMTADELAARLKVSVRTVYRDADPSATPPRPRALREDHGMGSSYGHTGDLSTTEARGAFIPTAAADPTRLRDTEPRGSVPREVTESPRHRKAGAPRRRATAQDAAYAAFKGHELVSECSNMVHSGDIAMY